MKIAQANDLFAPALVCYPQLSGFLKDGYFFSGSGSSFFKMV
jgi:4-diphosphocytidyl-2-C-methyl-D-erythritol kinase